MVVHPLESSGKHTRSTRGALPSIALHAAIVLVAVHATAHAATSPEQPATPPVVRFVPNAPSTPREHPATATRRGGVPPSIDPLVATKPMAWPTTIPDHVPTIDLSRGPVAVSDSEFGRGLGPALPSGSDDATRATTPFSATDVERQVSPIGAAPAPAYPESLRSSGIHGSVTAEFVVDTAGHVEPGSFRALASDNDRFTTAVRTAVLRTRFHPAEAGGRRVRQLVQESFSFVLE